MSAPKPIQVGQSWARVYGRGTQHESVDGWYKSVVVRHVGGKLWELMVNRYDTLSPTGPTGCELAGIMSEETLRSNAVLVGECEWFVEALGCQEHDGCRAEESVARDCFLSRRPGALEPTP